MKRTYCLFIFAVFTVKDALALPLSLHISDSESQIHKDPGVNISPSTQKFSLLQRPSDDTNARAISFGVYQTANPYHPSAKARSPGFWIGSGSTARKFNQQRGTSTNPRHVYSPAISPTLVRDHSHIPLASGSLGIPIQAVVGEVGSVFPAYEDRDTHPSVAVGEVGNIFPAYDAQDDLNLFSLSDGISAPIPVSVSDVHIASPLSDSRNIPRPSQLSNVGLVFPKYNSHSILKSGATGEVGSVFQKVYSHNVPKLVIGETGSLFPASDGQTAHKQVVGGVGYIFPSKNLPYADRESQAGGISPGFVNYYLPKPVSSSELAGGYSTFDDQSVLNSFSVGETGTIFTDEAHHIKKPPVIGGTVSHQYFQHDAYQQNPVNPGEVVNTPSVEQIHHFPGSNPVIGIGHHSNFHTNPSLINVNTPSVEQIHHFPGSNPVFDIGHHSNFHTNPSHISETGTHFLDESTHLFPGSSLTGGGNDKHFHTGQLSIPNSEAAVEVSKSTSNVLPASGVANLSDKVDVRSFQ